LVTGATVKQVIPVILAGQACTWRAALEHSNIDITRRHHHQNQLSTAYSAQVNAASSASYPGAA